MAKSRTNKVRRDAPVIATTPRVVPDHFSSPGSIRRSWPAEPSIPGLDGRFWRGDALSSAPLDYPDAYEVSGRRARVVAGKPSRLRPTSVPWSLNFAAPHRVVICVRRKVRRGVLHAKGVAGGRVSRGRRGPWSSIRCR